jgi:hypothetical protein
MVAQPGALRLPFYVIVQPPPGINHSLRAAAVIESETLSLVDDSMANPTCVLELVE